MAIRKISVLWMSLCLPVLLMATSCSGEINRGHQDIPPEASQVVTPSESPEQRLKREAMENYVYQYEDSYGIYYIGNGQVVEYLHPSFAELCYNIEKLTEYKKSAVEGQINGRYTLIEGEITQVSSDGEILVLCADNEATQAAGLIWPMMAYAEVNLVKEQEDVPETLSKDDKILLLAKVNTEKPAFIKGYGVYDGIVLRINGTSQDVPIIQGIERYDSEISSAGNKNSNASTSMETLVTDYSWIEGSYHLAHVYPVVLELSFDAEKPWENGSDWYVNFLVHDEMDGQILYIGQANYIGGGREPTFYGSGMHLYYDGYNFVLSSDDRKMSDASFFKDTSALDDEGGYLLPTNTQYISSYDLYDFDKETVSLIRNEIYARYGYNFKDARIQEYFESQSWYYPVSGLDASTFDMSVFNDYESENITTILDYEREMGWRP